MSTNIHSNYEQKVYIRSSKHINPIFQSSNNNNQVYYVKDTRSKQRSFSSTRNIYISSNPKARSESNSIKSSRAHNLSPLNRVYNFSKIETKSNRECSQLGNSWSSRNNELYGNIKGMMMYGQKREIKFSKFSSNHLKK